MAVVRHDHRKRTRARWYLSRGVPKAIIAAKLGVNRKTVIKWSNEGAGERALANLARRIRALTPHDRARLMALVKTSQEHA